MSTNGTFPLNRSYFYSVERVEYYLQKYKGYAIQGFILTFVNASIIMAVCVHRKIRKRKEFSIVIGLASVDLITGLGSLTAGLGRMLIIFNGHINTPVSRRWCLMMPWSWLFMLKPYVNGLMLAIVSIERFLAVVFPLQLRTKQQMFFMVLLPYLHALGPMLFLFYDSYTNQTQTFAPMCFTVAYMGNNWTYYKYSEPFFSTFSVLLYLVTLFVLINRKIAPGLCGASLEEEIRFQRRLTITLVLTGLCTFIFETCPRIVLVAAKQMGAKKNLTNIPIFGNFLYFIAAYQYIIRNLNPLSNMVIFSLRMRGIRMGIIRMYSCKKLTDPDLQNRIVPQKPNKKQIKKYSVNKNDQIPMIEIQ